MRKLKIFFLFLVSALTSRGGEPPVKADYSQEYMAEVLNRCEEFNRNIIKEFSAGDYRLSDSFFDSTVNLDSGYAEAPTLGVLGAEFRPIEIWFNSVTAGERPDIFDVDAKLKLDCQIIKVTGTLQLEAVFMSENGEEEYVPYSFILLGKMSLAGENNITIKGTYAADGYSTTENPRLIMLDDLNVAADGYSNRTFVGTLTKDGKEELCMWSDYRMPFRFDFDTGDGEMHVNEKYMTQEWRDYLFGDRVTIVEDTLGHRSLRYKNPWWK